MALGKPAVTTPRTLDLRSIQLAIESIRERLNALDAAVSRGERTVAAASSGAGSSASTAQLSAALRALTDRVARLEALAIAAGGDVIELLAEELVAIYDPVVPGSLTTCAALDPNDPVRRSAVLGLALNAAGPGEPVRIRQRGPQAISGASFEPGLAIFAGLGGLTQYPAYLDTAVPLGVAVSSTEVWVSVGGAALVAPPVYASDPRDDALPVTWRLLREKLGWLDDLLAEPDGFVVKVGDTLQTRVLVAGSGTGIVIDNGDGVGGDPMFALE